MLLVLVDICWARLIAKSGWIFFIMIRFWSEPKKFIDTQYLTFEFLQGANAEQLVGKFGDAVATLDQSKMVQISSDGPNVGFPF